MDHNKHMIDGAIGKALADRDGLDLQDAIFHHTGRSPGGTFFRWLKPIDRLWISNNIDVSNVCVMPFEYRVGNHHAFILDTPIKSLAGVDPLKIVRPASQRLISQILGCSKAFCDSLETNIIRHRLLKPLHDAHTGGYLSEETAGKVIIINKEGKAYMCCAEKICQKIKCCRIPFSPGDSIWICRIQVYYSLLHYHKEKIKPWKSETISTTVQHPWPSQLIYPRNCTMPWSMLEGMRILSVTQQTVLPEAPGEQEKNRKKARWWGGI